MTDVFLSRFYIFFILCRRDPAKGGDNFVIMLIGVLAIQGAFKEHSYVLRSLGVQTREVRPSTGSGFHKTSELEGLEGLVIPGGESTTMLKFLREEGLYTAIQEKGRAGLPIFGTCAGAIVLADMGLIDIEVERNAYGRQAKSFIAPIKISALQDYKIQNSKLQGSDGEFEGVFIRAPKIISVGEGVEILGELESTPVLVKQGNILVSTFHPELTDDDRVHRLFLKS